MFCTYFSNNLLRFILRILILFLVVYFELDAETTAPGWLHPCLPGDEKTRKTPPKISIDSSEDISTEPSVADTVSPSKI